MKGITESWGSHLNFTYILGEKAVVIFGAGERGGGSLQICMVHDFCHKVTHESYRGMSCLSSTNKCSDRS